MAGVDILNRSDSIILFVGFVCLIGGVAWLSAPWALIIGGALMIAAVVVDDKQ